MLDTVNVRSPKIGESEARQIEASCARKSSVQLGTGEVEYEITSAQLVGSYDARVSVRVLREELVHEQDLVPDHEYDDDGNITKVRFGTRMVTHNRPCKPFLEVGGSVHKAMLGHNVHGGPEAFSEAVRWFLDDVSERLGVPLPPAELWEVLRADWAEVYRLPPDAINYYFRGLNACEYPLREVARYKGAIHSPGRTTAVKAYSKGLEFAANDRKRLQSVFEPDDLEELQQVANEILRWEVGIKSRKLDKDHESLGRKPRVDDITPAYLRRVHDWEVRRLVREGDSEMKTVRKHDQVLERLNQVYPRRRAGALFTTWMLLAGVGESHARNQLTRATFYRHRKELADAGVSWAATDVHIDPRLSSLPDDFRPFRTDPRHVAGEHPAVAEKLAQYRVA